MSPEDMFERDIETLKESIRLVYDELGRTIAPKSRERLLVHRDILVADLRELLNRLSEFK